MWCDDEKKNILHERQGHNFVCSGRSLTDRCVESLSHTTAQAGEETCIRMSLSSGRNFLHSHSNAGTFCKHFFLFLLIHYFSHSKTPCIGVFFFFSFVCLHPTLFSNSQTCKTAHITFHLSLPDLVSPISLPAPSPVSCISVNSPPELHASKGETVSLTCTFTSTSRPTSKMSVDWSYRPQSGGPPQTVSTPLSCRQKVIL